MDRDEKGGHDQNQRFNVLNKLWNESIYFNCTERRIFVKYVSVRVLSSEGIPWTLDLISM
jgi:hypothetical protein